jgi:hypothetical protein
VLWAAVGGENPKNTSNKVRRLLPPKEANEK